ncbi:nucleotidyltransferase domain-containing protein [Paenibacillus dokdonensis]|uniref:nucleotidyltransferase domain-containing protein n=1 Tax=Paenibacillus dokdonensis TaxID=2567944 RepID=UPI001B3CA480|nr:hypothetical protein [Paenibacillus dokdonensis]
MQITSELQHALQQVSETLNQAGKCWLIGGSCGLLLQNVHLDAMPRDIDVYTDQVHMAELHHLLQDRSVDEPALSETVRYHSILSHYELEDYTMELVGGFRVRAQGSLYEVHVDKLLLSQAKVIELEGIFVPLMPLSHELVFNMLRNRADRYEAIAKIMRTDLQAHIPLLRQILHSSSFTEKHIRQIVSLLGLNRTGNDSANPLQALLREEPYTK